MAATTPIGVRATTIARRDVLKLADEFRSAFAGLTLDDIAQRFEIELYRSDGHASAADGIAIVEPAYRSVAVESLVRPGNGVRVWGGFVRKDLRAILINRHSDLPEREIFWHEFYHILFSPPSADDRSYERVVRQFRTNLAASSERHHYRVEERRADDFAAAMLVPSIAGINSLEELMERFQVSKRLARHAIELHAALTSSRNAA